MNPMGTKIEVRLAGAGGQGIVLAGIILAEAAGIHDGKHVVQTQSYGVEARGGASRAEVIISEEEIVFPAVLRPDILLAMNKTSMDRLIGTLKEDGTLIVNCSDVKEVPALKAKVFAIPLTDLGRQAGGEIVSNIVALGVLAGLTGIVSEGAIRRAVLSRVPRDTEELNMRALDLGLRVAREKFDSEIVEPASTHSDSHS